MTSSRPIHNSIFGDRVTFVETAAETQGEYTRVHVELAPGGGGPPLHYHTNYDETFTVIEGVLGIQLGEQILMLERGDRCTAPVGALHRFFNPSATERVVFEGLVTPASANFETMLQVAYGLANDGLTDRRGIPKSLEHLALTFMWGDTNLPGVFSVIAPAMRWLARRAMRRGVDKALIARYCHLHDAPSGPMSGAMYNKEEQAAFCL